MSKFKPMLAPNERLDVSTLVYPLLASFKYDGIRCTIVPGVGPRTRSLKEIPNHYVRGLLETLPHGYDGELMAPRQGNETHMAAAQRAFMREEGENEFTFHVFDNVSIAGPFKDRLASVTKM